MPLDPPADPFASSDPRAGSDPRADEGPVEPLAPALVDRPLRLGRAWRPVLYDRLGEAERGALARLTDDPDFWGVLVPVAASDDSGSRRRGGRSLKSLDRETALLLLTLADAPGPLPAYAREEPGVERQVAELILDGVLEVRDRGRWLTGPDALLVPGVGGEGPVRRRSSAPSAPARLSREALRWAAGLAIDDPRRLSGKLYSYGRLPVTAAWRRRLPDAEAVLEFLDLAGRFEAAGWRRRPADSAPGWIAWSPARPVATGAGGATWKLYVSPSPDALPRVAPCLPELLAASPATGFKVGADAAGLLRPDKMVAYFSSFDALAETSTLLAETLTDALAGRNGNEAAEARDANAVAEKDALLATAHGVPFTAAVDPAGLLSWGVDPPLAERPPGWSEGESWRLWVTNRLATALLSARSQASRDENGSAAEPWRFALERLRLEGVDVERWLPRGDLWASAAPPRVPSRPSSRSTAS